MSQNDKSQKEFDRCFRYYEKAIEGRNFHYQNYNAWVNLYAIFTGALFVGFYTLPEEQGIGIKLLVILLGLITSFCWHFSVKGYYHWMKSWISVVHSYEERLAEISRKLHNKPYYVYAVYQNKQEKYFDKNISTQKVTLRFTLFVVLGWGVLLVYTCLGTYLDAFFKTIISSCCCMICICVVVGALILLIAVWMNNLNSNVEKMKTDIYGKDVWK